MIEANALKKFAILPDSREIVSTIAGVMTARMTEYSANVWPASRRMSRRVLTHESSAESAVFAIP